VSGLEAVLSNSPDIKGAKGDVDSAIDMYIHATTSLTATIGVQILVNQRERDILQWLWTGDFEERHATLRKSRVLHSGQWFLESDEYNQWVGDGPSTLICQGIGKLRWRD
jgi:hypothetical protein